MKMWKKCSKSFKFFISFFISWFHVCCSRLYCRLRNVLNWIHGCKLFHVDCLVDTTILNYRICHCGKIDSTKSSYFLMLLFIDEWRKLKKNPKIINQIKKIWITITYILTAHKHLYIPAYMNHIHKLWWNFIYIKNLL